MTSMKSKYIEIENLPVDGLVCLCKSYRGTGIYLRRFHNKSNSPCGIFNHGVVGS